MAAVTVPERALRADAERNRQAILCAAADVFANEGSHVTLEHIAEVAGVGVGTIYRRFRSVEDLLTVVMEAKMTRYADEAEAASARARTQPWDAFRDFVMFMLEQQARDLAFGEAILSPGLGTELFRVQNRRAVRAAHELVEAIRRAGAVRPDFDATDLFMLMHANAGLSRATRRSAPNAWKRFGEYMLQAFHDPGTVLEPPSGTWIRARRVDKVST